jgi:hypothetical protein
MLSIDILACTFNTLVVIDLSLIGVIPKLSGTFVKVDRDQEEFA